MDYDSLLKRARESLPDAVFEKERFDIPKVLGHIQGNRTVLSNFFQIAKTLGRPPEHVLKFLLREIAAPAKTRKNDIIINTLVSAKRINEIIRIYAEDFVLCPDCGKPDTKIVNEGGFAFLRCMACGGKKQVKSKI